MARKRFTPKDRARIFAANGGICHICQGKIDGVREVFEIEHVIAWELTRDDSDDNLRPAHAACHKRKTHGEDRPAINQAKRREAKHTGAIRPKQSIRSAGFPTAKPRQPKPQLPPRSLYAGGQPQEPRDDR
jgi:5-methylcytosine-specific restriction protein A